MDFKVEDVAPCKKRVVITVPAERVREELETQYREINKGIVLPGVRPGHAPRRLLEARFGTKVAEEAKQKIVEAAYDELLEGKKVAPLRRPTVDVAERKVEADKPFEFSFEVTTRPEFDLGTWKGLEVKVPALHVSDADVEGAVERLRIAEGTLVPADDGVKDDDVAIVDWTAKEGDTALGSGENVYYRVGLGVLDGLVVDGLDAALLGKAAPLSVVLKGRAAPDDARAPLAGKEFDVSLALTDVKRFRPADLDADFLKRHDYDDEEEMRTDVRRKMLRAGERERDHLAEDRLVDLLVEATRVPLPEEVVAEAVEGWVERRRVEAQAEGIPEEEITKEAAGAKDEVRRRVEQDLRRHFVLEKICEAEDVKVPEGEVLGAIEQMARDNRRTSAEMRTWFEEEPGRLAELRTHLRHAKAKEALRRAATVVEEAPSPPAPPTEPSAPSEAEPKGKPKKGK